MDERVSKFFEHQPDVKEVFQTTDGFMFLKEYDAKMHATTLEDNKVKKHINSSITDTEELLEDEDLEDQE